MYKSNLREVHGTMGRVWVGDVIKIVGMFTIVAAPNTIVAKNTNVPTATTIVAILSKKIFGLVMYILCDF